MTDKALLLNRNYQPVSVINWDKSFVLYFLDKVDILEYHEDTIKTVNKEYKIPSVVRLRKGSGFKFLVRKFSKINVFKRDMFVCQYCGHAGSPGDLTFDHVIPKSRGGKTNWKNIVTCCKRCNRAKANKTPEEAGMKLLNEPKAPGWNHHSFLPHDYPENWKFYLQS